MKVSSLTNRLTRGRGTGIADWACWQLPPLLRGYVVSVIALAAVTLGAGIALTPWRAHDVVVFLVLACCGTISMASTPRIVYRVGGATRDFSTMWLLPAAVLLPPVYSMLIAIPVVATLFLFVHRGQLYRRVFSAASLGLSYVVASAVFRAIPASFAGPNVGSSLHAFTWCLAVGAVEILGCRLQHYLIVAAVKMSDPSIRVLSGEFDRDTLQELFVEIDLSILTTVAVAVSPLLVVIALPSVLLVRRFLVHPVLVAQSRVDSKTGLLNVSTWEAEAEVELSRSARTNNPVALALVDIDHFKLVNDTYGHLVGDRVLKAIAEALTGQSRDYDRAGRFGGEEFVLLLAQTSEKDACKIAERLRGYISSLQIPIEDRPDAPTLTVTISVGVTAMARGESFELTDLLAAADSAMYHAKQAGRNRVAFATPLRDMGIDAGWTDADSEAAPPPAGADPGARQPAALPAGATPLSSHRVVLVQMDQPAISLCLSTLLSVVESARPAPAIASQCGPRTCMPLRPTQVHGTSPRANILCLGEGRRAAG
jgi:diguanylate cyclase (GGDEF)-like protein